MRIITYAATEPHAPPGHAFLARIRHDDGTFHPVVFNSISEANVRQKAGEWWDAELAKAQKKAAPKKKPAAPDIGKPITAPQVVDDPGDVL